MNKINKEYKIVRLKAKLLSLLTIYILFIAIHNIPYIHAGQQAQAALPVDLVVNSNFSLSLSGLGGGASAPSGGPDFAFGVSPTAGTVDFGTYTPGNNPASKSVEIYCTSNTGNNWQLDISGDALTHTQSGEKINGSPVYWSFSPAPGNPGDYQQAQGTFFNGSMPTSSILYRSSPGEMGDGILVILGLNANLTDLPKAGSYSTVITITMHE